MKIKKAFVPLHKFFAGSKTASLLIAKIRNQCDLVIRRRFSVSNMDPAQNGEYALLKHVLPNCAVFFDVGANKGEWTSYIIAEKGPQLYEAVLFEPGTNAFAQLKNTFNNNPHVELNNVAVSNVPGILEFYEEENAGGMSSAVKGWSAEDVEPTQVPCTTIDQEIAAKNLKAVDFIKIDVEGFDLKVMEGVAKSLKAQLIGLIQFEYNECWFDTGSSLAKAYRLLTGNGYKIYIIRPNGLMEYDVKTYGDFYSLSNFIAVSPAYHTYIKDLIL